MAFSNNLSLYSYINPEWHEVFGDELQKPYFQELAQFIEEERRHFTVFPRVEDVWQWTWLSNHKNVRVIILGQDPYSRGQAHGLAFSVLPNTSVTRSLNNIFHEVHAEIPDFKIPNHGSLEGWARQGVLLLNTILTIREGEQKSHRNQGWEKFTDAVISWFNESADSLVFMLWGNHAQKRKVFFKERHLVLTAPHPSPLSASKGFFGCNHFQKANEFLLSHNKIPIEWDYLPSPEQLQTYKCFEDIF